MNLIYRKITKSELPQVVELVLRVFDEFEAPEYPAEGVQTFHNIMADEPFLNQICIYGAFDESVESTGTTESPGTANFAGTIIQWHSRFRARAKHPHLIFNGSISA